MPKQVSTSIIQTTGGGKPDYTLEVSSAIQRSGIYLKANQFLEVIAICFTDQVPHPYLFVPWIKPPLTPGASAHLIDTSTGVAVPVFTPIGYIATNVQAGWGMNQDVELWFYLDGLLMGSPGITSSGNVLYQNPAYAITTQTVDPLALSPHSFDLVVVNAGAQPVEGGMLFANIIEDIGSPPLPTTKVCQCPACTHLQTVVVGTTRILCANCGNTYIVYDFSKLKVF